MPLETPINYIPDLVPTNPTVTDGLNQGDDHLRGIKLALKNTFPNFTDAALTSTQAQIDAAVAAIATAANVPTGSIHQFPLVKSVSGYLRCDGSIYNIADHPTLGAYLGSAFGGNGTTTFGVPNLEDTGRYLRSTKTGLAPGSTQANALKNHTHGVNGTTNSGGTHTHSLSVSSSVNDPGHGHDLILNGVQGGSVSVGVATGASPFSGGNPQCQNQSLSVAHNTTGITVDTSGSANSGGAHTHGFSTTSDNAGDDTESRPETFVVVFYIKD